jgi:hypothetical protein
MGNGVIGWMVISQKRLKFGMKSERMAADAVASIRSAGAFGNRALQTELDPHKRLLDDIRTRMGVRYRMTMAYLATRACCDEQ